MNGMIRMVALALLAFCCLGGAACVETTSILCPNGRRCPAGTFCAASRDICIRFECGDGVVDGPEEVCDDGNNLDRDGCSADCKSTERCGDGIRDPGEACDDGNDVDGDGCQASCALPLCGDGILDEPFYEACDEGPANSSEPDAKCRRNCQPQRCGDGIQDSGEVCDDGNLAAGDGCTPDCRSDETCGNGYTDILFDELCDDGNLLSRDGCTSTCATEEPRWVEHTFTPLPSTSAYSMAYDAARGRVVLFGGKDRFDVPNNETWEWDGVAWSKITPAGTSPSARADHAMAYDAARKRVVLFGGFAGGTSRGDTWAWDGKTWSEVTPTGSSSSPAPRHACGMAYDAARRRIVLFGGSSVPNSGLDDLWEWDGAAWNEITPAGSSRPSARFVPAMAYDAVRGRVVLYGGSYDNDVVDRVSSRSDTWEWDGRAWTEQHPVGPLPSAPPWRATHAMAYDAARGRVVLYDGPSLWRWDGMAWIEQRAVGSLPFAIRDNDMVYDVAHDRLVVVDDGETWLWEGTGWTELTLTDSSPGGRYRAAMAYDADRGRVVLFDGGTWEWNGATWAQLTPAHSPRCCGTMVYDAGRGRTLLYDRGKTWAWDGTDWTQLDPSRQPPVRSQHAMVYDAARRRVVLFGGRLGDEGFDDTWEWDGTDWIRRALSGSSPPPRYDHAMAYDARRGRIVVFGGRRSTASSAAYSDTWEWDGSQWAELTSAGTTPSPRSGHAMTYDPDRQRTVLLGGFDGIYRDDTWEWDGIRWSEAPTVVSPEARASAAMVYDAARGRIVLFGGGEDFPRWFDRTWEFSYGRDDHVYETCIHGFDNDGDGLIGCADPDCWGHCAPSCPPDGAGGCDSSFPHCGDALCNVHLESCVICPQDCGPCPSVCGDFLCNSGESCPADCNPP